MQPDEYPRRMAAADRIEATIDRIGTLLRIILIRCGTSGDNPEQGGMHSVYRIDDAYRFSAAAVDTADEPDWMRSIALEDLGNGMRLHRFDFVAKTEHRMRGEGPPTFCIAIFLDGRGSMSIEDGPSLTIRPGTTVLFHSPHRVRGENRVAAGCHVRCLDLRLAPDLLCRLGMPALSALIRAFPDDCSVQNALLVGRPTSAALAAIANDVFCCRLSGMARRFYLQAKVLEALAQVIVVADSGGASRAGLTRRDHERVREAVALLAERYQEPWTISGLSSAVGLNQKKLKSGFRLIVGRTVHAYLEETRMTSAARLLAEGSANVTQAALAVGYDNFSYFAKLFRRRHGMSPREWRRRQV
jgi:AraC-like DNA-binding protein